MALGDLSGALAEAEAARGLLESMSEAEPSNAMVHRFLSECHLLRGEALERVGRTDEAELARASAHAAIAPLMPGSRDGAMLATFALALRSLKREQDALDVIDRLRDQGYVDSRIPEL